LRLKETGAGMESSHRIFPNLANYKKRLNAMSYDILLLLPMLYALWVMHEDIILNKED